MINSKFYEKTQWKTNEKYYIKERKETCFVLNIIKSENFQFTIKVSIRSLLIDIWRKIKFYFWKIISIFKLNSKFNNQFTGHKACRKF